jgi:hypothetical protein
MRITSINVFAIWVVLVGGACSGDNGAEADKLGVGAGCSQNDDCQKEQRCLDFKGGYCGIEGCSQNKDCPEGSVCVAHDDGNAYCFRTCVEKIDCNRNRSAEFEANCSSNVDFAEAGTKTKVCVPPSSDTTIGDDDAATANKLDAGNKKK